MIALSIIFGNEEDKIVRFLKSWKTEFDLLCAVRANGCSFPDKTKELIIEWCQANQKQFAVSVYRNKDEFRNWPHVDDFGAARNLSLSLAESRGDVDAIFWADCDDLFEGQPGTIRRHAAELEEGTVIYADYLIEDGKASTRERIFKPGTGYFAPNIHETLQCYEEPKKRIYANDYRHIHAPVITTPEKAKAKRERNTRILNSSIKNVGGYYYYLALESYQQSKRADFRRLAELAILNGCVDWQQYWLRLKLGETSGTYDEAMSHYGRAMSIFPGFPDALAEMICASICYGKRQEAGYYARMILSLSQQDSLAVPMTDRSLMDWRRYDIAMQGFRVANDKQGMQAVNEIALRTNAKPDISLIHATRKNHVQAQLCRDEWLMKARNGKLIEHIFVVDDDDEESKQALEPFGYIINQSEGCVGAWNTGAKAARGGIIIQLSDDFSCPVNWDVRILEHLEATKKQVLLVDDCLREDGLVTLAIVTRAFYEDRGNLLPSAYTGVYSDNELTDYAKKKGYLIDARHLKFPHHWHIKSEAKIEQNTLESYAKGKAIYEQRKGKELPWT